MLIGSHVSMSGKNAARVSRRSINMGESTFMIYTGAPQKYKTKNIEDLNIEGQQAMKTYGLSNIVVHAPYIINIANTTKTLKYLI